SLRNKSFRAKFTASTANLKFLSVSLQVRHRHFKFKAALKSIIYKSSLDSEVRIKGRRGNLRTSESELSSGILGRLLSCFCLNSSQTIDFVWFTTVVRVIDE